MGPLERDPTGEEEIGILSLLKFIVIVLVCVTLAGKFFTGSYTWDYKGKWLQLKTYWPVSYELINFSSSGLFYIFFFCVQLAKSTFILRRESCAVQRTGRPALIPRRKLGSWHLCMLYFTHESDTPDWWWCIRCFKGCGISTRWILSTFVSARPRLWSPYGFNLALIVLASTQHELLARVAFKLIVLMIPEAWPGRNSP